MRYTVEPVKEYPGAKFVLTEGSASELYNEVTGKLSEFYKNQNSAINIPATPYFETFSPGEVRLPFITFRKEEEKPVLNQGNISVSYFKGRTPSAKKQSRNEKDIDYATSYTPTSKKAYESITLFFNTFPVNIDKEHLKLANEMQRDNFLSTLEDRLK